MKKAKKIQTKIFKPHYSGKLSEKFWEKINSLPKNRQSSLYASGVLLQNMEGLVLTWLNNEY